MNNKDLQKEAEETEFLTADEQKITELVGSLERVSAPNDFEFRLKARIASGKGESYQIGYWQWLRYLLPVGATAFVLAFVLYGTNFFAPSKTDDQRANVEPTKSEEVVTMPLGMPSNTVIAVSNSNKAEDLPVNSVGQKDFPRKSVEEKPIFILDSANLNKKGLPKKSTEEDGGGSRLSAITTPPVRLPVNLNPDKELEKPQDFENSQAFTAEQILKNIGIETVTENNKLKVKSIRQNSPAGISDVREGDFIEAIDSQKINGDSKARNLKGAKKIIVLRDGKSITIDLKLN